MKKYIVKIPYLEKKENDEADLSRRQAVFLIFAGFIEEKKEPEPIKAKPEQKPEKGENGGSKKTNS